MAHCTGYVMDGETGMMYCKATPVAAYTWHAVPFNYKGKPGAAVCAGHEDDIKRHQERYPRLTLIERINAETTVHAFEKSGCGRAPFKFIGCESRVGPLRYSDPKTGVTTEIGAPGQPMGTCAHCGTGIAVCCIIEDADGKQFIVGNVCVGKTGDKGLIKVTRQAINARAAEARHKKAIERFAWIKENLERARPVLEGQKHPGGFAGKTAYDWAVWMTKNAGDAGRKTVEARMRAALGEEAK